MIEVIDENDNVPYFDNVDGDGFIQWVVTLVHYITLLLLWYSASVLEGESNTVIATLVTSDADTDEINTNSTVHLVSAIGVTSNMDGMDN